MNRIILICALLVALSISLACADETINQPTTNIDPSIPWGTEETATYDILEDDNEIGLATISMTSHGTETVLNYVFDFPEQQFCVEKSDYQ